MNANWTSRAIRTGCLTLAAGWLVVVAGCANLDLDEKSPWSSHKNDKPSTPVKVVVVWKDAVLYKPNEPAMRGFGGRLMFYDGKSEKPIRVDGQLVVYAFDEEGRGPTDSKPDRKYVFAAEQFAKHYSESQIGHSYSVWLPWDKADGTPKKISLIVRFQPAEGDVVVSEQTASILPGVTPAEDAKPAKPAAAVQEEAAKSGEVRPAGYEATASDADQADAEQPSAKRIETHTIALPARLGRPMPTAVQTTVTARPATPAASTRFAPARSPESAAPVAPPEPDRTPSPLAPAG